MGWVLSYETGIFEVPISFGCREGNTTSCALAMRGMDLAQSETPCAWRRPLYGTWEISSAPALRLGPVQEGHNPHAEHVRGREVGLGHSTAEATEQGKTPSCGGRGGKGPAQVERLSAGRGPDSEPGSSVVSIGGCAPGGDQI